MRTSPLRRSGATATVCQSLTLALCLFLGCCAPGSVSPRSIGTTDTCVFPAHFEIDHETELNTFEALPPEIRARLRRYLDEHLGSDFVSQLRFRQASFVDPAQVPKVVEADRQLGRIYVAYVVLFDIPLSDGSTYCAGVQMAADGDVVMGIGLPKIAASPTKARIVTQSAAEVVAQQHGVSNPNHGPLTRLGYAPDRDALVWGIAEVSETKRRAMVTTCYIDAHTGQFLGWSMGEIVF